MEHRATSGGMKLGFGLGIAGVVASICACGGLTSVPNDASAPQDGASDAAAICPDDAWEVPHPEAGYGGWAVAVNDTGVYAVWRTPTNTADSLFRNSTRLTGPFYRFANLAVDDSSVYWVDGNTIQSIPNTGGTPTALYTSASPAHALTSDGTNLYWANDDNSVSKTPKTGGSVTSLIAPSSDGVVRIVVDSIYIYVEFLNQGVMRVPIVGGSSALVVRSDLGVGGHVDLIGVDASFIYWRDQVGVSRTPLAGGMTQPVWAWPANLWNPTTVLLNGGAIYTANTVDDVRANGCLGQGESFWRVNVDGTNPVQLNAPRDLCYNLVGVDSKWVYARSAGLGLVRFCK